MSGGRFNYQDMTLKDEIFGYASRDEIHNVFEDREITELIYDVFDLIHAYDWYASGDTSKTTYLEAKDAFKQKWFGDKEARVKHIVDEAIKGVKKELYETYGFTDV